MPFSQFVPSDKESNHIFTTLVLSKFPLVQGKSNLVQVPTGSGLGTKISGTIAAEYLKQGKPVSLISDKQKTEKFLAQVLSSLSGYNVRDLLNQNFTKIPEVSRTISELSEKYKDLLFTSIWRPFSENHKVSETMKFLSESFEKAKQPGLNIVDLNCVGVSSSRELIPYIAVLADETNSTVLTIAHLSPQIKTDPPYLKNSKHVTSTAFIIDESHVGKNSGKASVWEDFMETQLEAAKKKLEEGGALIVWKNKDLQSEPDVLLEKMPTGFDSKSSSIVLVFDPPYNAGVDSFKYLAQSMGRTARMSATPVAPAGVIQNINELKDLVRKSQKTQALEIINKIKEDLEKM